MSLAGALLPLLPGGAGVIAFVGAGGKTSALFSLAAELTGLGRRVLVTTTTQLADPRLVPVPPPGATVVFRPEMEHAGPGESGPEPVPGATLLLSREAAEAGKVKGIHPSRVAGLKSGWDVVLVEADGSRSLPVKAPASHEPVIPPGTDLVVGVVGLECLGRPMDGRTVHRPERFAEVTGCPAGAPIVWKDLEALVRHPDGLFKGAAAKRVLLLNKSDLAAFLPSGGQLAALGLDGTLVGALGRSR
jgi:probable selenium-dependent hydroxylase accessory protein YqeC